MRTPSRFTRNFANLHGLTRLAMGLSLGLLPSVANANPREDEAGVLPTMVGLDHAPGVETGSVCSGMWRCHAHVHATHDGRVKAFAAPQGFGATDLVSAYNIPTTI